MCHSLQRLSVLETHIYKKYVAPARIPFRCTLFHIKCQNKNKTLHRKAEKEAGGKVPKDCLKESACPYYVTEADYHVYSTKESRSIWYELRQKRMGAGDRFPFLDGQCQTQVVARVHLIQYPPHKQRPGRPLRT